MSATQPGCCPTRSLVSLGQRRGKPSGKGRTGRGGRATRQRSCDLGTRSCGGGAPRRARARRSGDGADPRFRCGASALPSPVDRDRPRLRLRLRRARASRGKSRGASGLAARGLADAPPDGEPCENGDRRRAPVHGRRSCDRATGRPPHPPIPPGRGGSAHAAAELGRGRGIQHAHADDPDTHDSDAHHADTHHPDPDHPDAHDADTHHSDADSTAAERGRKQRPRQGQPRPRSRARPRCRTPASLPTRTSLQGAPCSALRSRRRLPARRPARPCRPRPALLGP